MSTLRKAVFPAAGLGTRFLPATKAQPKEMLPLVDKPIIQYGVEEAVASGVDNIILVTGRGKNAIEDHFDRSVELETFLESRGKHELLNEVRKISNLINFAYVRQGEPLGLGHAVLVTRALVGNEPFAVILGDDVIDATPPALKQMIDVFEKVDGPVLCVERVPRDEISSYGVIAYEPDDSLPPGTYRVTDLVEKPKPEEAPSDLAIIGRYILTPDIFKSLEETAKDRTGEIQLTNGLKHLLRSRPIYACEVIGARHDTGNKLGFLKAVVYFALRRPDLAKPFVEYSEGIVVRRHLGRRLDRPAGGRRALDDSDVDVRSCLRVGLRFLRVVVRLCRAADLRRRFRLLGSYRFSDFSDCSALSRLLGLLALERVFAAALSPRTLSFDRRTLCRPCASDLPSWRSR